MPNPYTRGSKEYEEYKKKMEEKKRRRRKGGALYGGKTQREQLKALERD